jgi:hypothetical protein
MSSSHEDAMQRLTEDTRTTDGSPHEHAAGAPGPRDLVDPHADTNDGPADGDTAPREQQKREGGM